jgi:hypothetical protein
MRYLFSLLCLLTLIDGTVSPAMAQEERVPLTADGSLIVVSSEIEDQLNLFPDVEGFQEAKLYKVSPTEYELVIVYSSEGRTLRERRSLTKQDVSELRSRITRALAAANLRATRDDEGRYGLLAATTVLSLAEGALIGDAIGLESDGVGTMSLIGGATGFFAPLILSRKRGATEGEADMVFYGGTQGFLHGVQIFYLVSDAGVDEGRGLSALAALGGLSESIAGYVIAREKQWTGGHAEMTSFTGYAGNAAGLGTALMIGGEEASERLASGLSLTGSLVGGYLGHRLGRTNRYTQGDARIYFLSGLTFANLTGSVYAAATTSTENPNVAAGLVTASGVAGLLVGRSLVREKRFSKTEGNITVLGGLAGSLFGAGIGVTSDASGDATALLQATGALAGAAITYGFFSKDARRRAVRMSGIDLNVSVMPAVGAPSGPGFRYMKSSNHIRPRVNIRATF